MFDRLLPVDPGDHTAWAFLDKDFFPATGEFKTNRKYTMIRQLDYMAYKFSEVIEELEPKLILIEGVGLWEGSDKSRTSAVRGNTFKLAYLIGVYACSCFERGIQCQIVDPRQWKGSLSKEGTKYRVDKILDVSLFASEHIIDAIALGLSTNKEIWKLKKSVDWKVNKRSNLS